MKGKGRSGEGNNAGAGGAPRARRRPAAGRRTGRTQPAARHHESEQQFRAIVESTSEWIWSCDVKGIHTYSNNAVRTILGYAPEEVVGESALMLLHPDDVPRARESIVRAVAGRLGWSALLLRWRHKDGTYRFLESTAAPIIGPEKEVLGWHGADRDVTERMRSQEALRRSEERYRDLFENAIDPICVVDVHQNYVDVNRRTVELFGYSREELLAMNVRDMIPPEQLGRSEREFVKLAEQGAYEHFTGRVRKKDGTYLDIEVSSSAIMENGRIVGSRDILRDITDRKLAEKTLRESEEKFRALVETSSDWIWAVDENGVYTYASPRVKDILGYAVEDVVGKTPFTFMPPGERARVAGAFGKLVATRTPLVAFENVNLHQDGSVVVLETSGMPIFDAEGGFKGYRGVDRDITRRKKAEELLRDSESRMRSIVESIPVGMHMYRLENDGRLVFIGANPAADRILGVDNSGFIGRTIEEAFPQLKETEVPQRYREVAATGTMWRTEHIEYHENAIQGAFEVHAFQTAPNNVVAAFEDITERKRAEEKLRANEKFVWSVLNSVDEGFITLDRDYRILMANRAFCAQVNAPPEEVIGKPCYQVAQRLGRPCFEEGEDCAVERVFETGQPQTTTNEYTREDRSSVLLESKAFPLRDETGAITSVIKTTTDISARRLLEEERLKTQKLESIGTLAGGIAHDFNNLLQGVFGYISMAKLTFDQRERSFAMLEQAEQALHQSVNLTSQLLTFSKGGKPIKKVLAMRPVIENAVKFALSGSRIGFSLSIEDDLLTVEADEGQMTQVLQNIVLNAEQAMPLGGKVLIVARNIPAGGALPGGEQGSVVEITIADQGIGMPAEHLSRIFDPYFTTKEKGSGLGLATAFSIVKNHGGTITVSSDLGKGSTFIIRLPASGAPVERIAAAPAVSPGRRGRVLVMDDEKVVRDVAGELIRMLGHEVEFAEHGEAAIESYRLARAAGRPFDIVILDLTIRGGMGGLETLKRLRETDPGVKAVVSSGYADDSSMSEYGKQGFAAVLKKPYELAELGNVLTTLME